MKQNRDPYQIAVKVGLTIYVLAASAWLARSDSLFPIKEANQALRGSTSASAASLFSDVRAHNVGDLLNITIAESTTAQSSANTKISQDEGVTGFGGTGLIQRLFKDLQFTATNSRTGNGAGQTTRSGSLVTTLTVQVREVLPNGVLKVEGTRLVTINRETQRVTFVGLVRPEDITTDNSVQSSLVAGVEVRYDGRGIVAETQRRGIFSTIFRFLF